MIKLKFIDNSTVNNYDVSQIGCAYFLNRYNEYKQIQNKINVYCEYILLKSLLKPMNIDLDKLDIIKTAQGKPIFENINLFFSISHSKNIVAVAISNRPIGIDIQTISPYNEKIARRYFNKTEFAAIEKSNHKDDLFTKYWTKYESQIKLFGSRKTMLENDKKSNSKFKTITDLNSTKYSLCISTSKHISLDNPTTLW